MIGPHETLGKLANMPKSLQKARRCGARNRRGTACLAPAMKNGRCKFHGGKSTGPKTSKGRERCRLARWRSGISGQAWRRFVRANKEVARLHSQICEIGFARAPLELLRAGGLLTRRKYRALVMDYVPGADLRRESRYPLGQLLDLYVQALEALDRIHALGIVHADVKPENMIVGPAGS